MENFKEIKSLYQQLDLIHREKEHLEIELSKNKAKWTRLSSMQVIGGDIMKAIEGKHQRAKEITELNVKEAERVEAAKDEEELSNFIQELSTLNHYNTIIDIGPRPTINAPVGVEWRMISPTHRTISECRKRDEALIKKLKFTDNLIGQLVAKIYKLSDITDEHGVFKSTV